MGFQQEGPISTATILPLAYHKETSGPRRSSALRGEQSEGPISTSSLTSPSNPILTNEIGTREDYGYSNANRIPSARWPSSSSVLPFSYALPLVGTRCCASTSVSEHSNAKRISTATFLPLAYHKETSGPRRTSALRGEQSEGLISTSSLISPSNPIPTNDFGTREDYGCSNAHRIPSATWPSSSSVLPFSYALPLVGTRCCASTSASEHSRAHSISIATFLPLAYHKETSGPRRSAALRGEQSEGLISTSSLTSPSNPILTNEIGTREDYGYSNANRIPSARWPSSSSVLPFSYALPLVGTRCCASTSVSEHSNAKRISTATFLPLVYHKETSAPRRSAALRKGTIGIPQSSEEDNSTYLFEAPIKTRTHNVDYIKLVRIQLHVRVSVDWND
jgi:hypothetical protein